MRKLKFVENEIYHVYNRGVEKRTIFRDEHDCMRFIHDLFEFNDEKPALNLSYRFCRKPNRVTETDPPCLKARMDMEREPRKLLVEILMFALMPNHFHLLLREKKKGGIRKFMHKLGTGYALHFNQRHERSGILFQGRFKAVHVNKDKHLLHLPYYIHANPLDLNEAHPPSIDFLDSYRWSSHLDYCGWNNFPSVTQREFLLDFFGGEDRYRKSMNEWLKKRENNTNGIRDVLIEKNKTLVA